MTYPEQETLSAVLSYLKSVLTRYRFSVLDEKQTQAQIERVFTEHQIPFKREVRLADSGVIDFIVGQNISIGLEVKVKTNKMATYRQCKRYCESGALNAISLLTFSPMVLPPDISGIPTQTISLSRAYLG